MNGSIDHRPDRPRPWRARYTGPDGKQYSISKQSKGEAEGWLREELITIDRGTWVNPRAGRLPYGKHAQDWLDTIVNVKPSTKAGYRGLLLLT